MIKNIIFDFGDIFIDLDKTATVTALKSFGLEAPTTDLITLAERYEKGLLASLEFIASASELIPAASSQALIDAWNAIILFFPEYRLDFIEKLAKSKRYRLFLLSNTNALHIEKVKENMTVSRYNRFKSCFEKFYLSHEIHLRKPDREIYSYVLEQNNLNSNQTLFVDDTLENIKAAETLGIHTWHLKVGMEDVIHLKTKLKL